MGELLDSDPTPEAIAQAIDRVVADRQVLESKKKASLKKWSELYNAEKNYSSFAIDIAHL